MKFEAQAHLKAPAKTEFAELFLEVGCLHQS